MSKACNSARRVGPLVASLVLAMAGAAVAIPIGMQRKSLAGAEDSQPSPVVPSFSETSDSITTEAEDLDRRELSRRLLLLALREAVWGPPVLCDVRQQIWLGDSQWTGIGKYVGAGQGTGKLKFQIQMPGKSGTHVLLQVSDGQRLHTVEQLGEESHRRVVDLEGIRERLQLTSRMIASPRATMYLAIGGPAEVIRKLHGQYEFTDIETKVSGSGSRLWILSGQLADSLPPSQPVAFVDQQLVPLNQSGQMPARAVVTITEFARPSNGAAPQFWLSRLEFVRSSTNDDATPGFKVVTEWDEPRVLQRDVDAAVFEYRATGARADDETELYMPPTDAPLAGP